MSGNNLYRADNVRPSKFGFSFDVLKESRHLVSLDLSVPGRHNVMNALAAVAVCDYLGVSPDGIKSAIEEFKGAGRRFEFYGQFNGFVLADDYAHHPTEIAANITALKLTVKEPLTVVFKPHTFSRTASLWDDFCSALSLADKVIVTDIYPAREAPIEGINARRLAEAIGSSAEYSPDSEVYARLDDQSHRGAVVLMGAGDMEDIKYEVLNK
jgi:UDP-N-acetylmuramate--alanine ligase